MLNQPPDLDTQMPWYGVQTKSNCEKLAALSLQNKGFHPFLPVRKSRRLWSDRTVDQERPLFPGYLFCRFDASRMLPIMMTPGVARVVSFGKSPVPIESEEINAIRSMLDSGLFVQEHPFLREGQRVRIIKGPLKNLEGILVKTKSEMRVIASVSMLQRSVSVEVDRDWLSLS